MTWVMKTLGQTGLEPQYLDLELTESLIAEDTEKVIATVNRLKAAGVKLSIDDFGTGYSSLSYLKRYRVDTLKIDQSFVRTMLTEVDDAAITLAVISLAHRLRMAAVAEGVETAEQCRFLRLNRCDAMQGYFFSRPVPAAELEVILRSDKRLAATQAPTAARQPLRSCAVRATHFPARSSGCRPSSAAPPGAARRPAQPDVAEDSTPL